MAAPQLAFPFLANLFTAFAFGMLWLDLRRAVAVCLAVVFGAGIVFAAVGDRIGAPTARPVEVFLVWSYFSLVLGRCLLVSVAANENRARLAASRRKLGYTLEQVQRLASRVELTRALNRRSLVSALERECARTERGGPSFCVAMIGLDHFKRINDTLGHSIGDELLQRVADRIVASLRPGDEIARGRFDPQEEVSISRLGGDEFTLMIGKLSDPKELAPIARRILDALARPTHNFTATSFTNLERLAHSHYSPTTSLRLSSLPPSVSLLSRAESIPTLPDRYPPKG